MSTLKDINDILTNANSIIKAISRTSSELEKQKLIDSKTIQDKIEYIATHATVEELTKLEFLYQSILNRQSNETNTPKR